ncbi:hypothetical protein BDN72DRAFT_959023 [Pluteus cervinus]|uniref:Uncharacterized protein n=1 Tax=Pluteus cervinus TaxID=181527 RepID=A0ACD3AXM3_9AGAR|nr:hypothetical protein BDN72DRAFT_959023 [Pluteus cervinus]
MSIFPVELIENILAHVYAEYRPLENPVVLHQCALVCRTWRTISQSFIFSEILLSASHLDNKIKILRGNSCLHRYIRTLWLGNDGGICGVEAILNVLPRVQELYVLEYGLATVLIDGPAAERVLGNLTSLALEGSPIPFWIGTFYYCHSLRELKMRNSTFDVADTQKFPRNRAITRLHSLHISGTASSHMEILQWMLTPQCPFDLTALTTFRTSDRSDELESYAWIQEIVKLCAPTLQDIMIDPPTSIAGPNPSLTSGSLLYPSTLFNLRVITISIMQERYDYTNYIPWMTTFFSLLPIFNRLEEIRIPYMFRDHFDELEEGRIQIDLYDLEALDTTLTSSHLELKRVVFAIYKHSRCEFKILGPLLRELLPRLNEKGVLEIEISTTLGHMAEHDCWWRLAS